MITLKHATEADVEHLITLGKEMHAEGAFSFLPFNEDKAQAFILRNIRDKNACVFLVLSGEKPIGMHIGCMTSYFFSHSMLASGIVTYVPPRYRGGRAALLLLKAFINWGKERKAAEVYIGVSVGIHLKNTDKFFRHLGFRHVGGNYKLRL